MFTAAQTRTHVGDHHSTTVPSKASFQNLGQFAASERSMLLLKIDSTDTFFESKQTFVDFSTINSCLLIGLHCISSSLAASQIDEAHSAVCLVVVTIVQSDGQYGVRPGGVNIRSSLASRPLFQACC